MVIIRPLAIVVPLKDLNLQIFVPLRYATLASQCLMASLGLTSATKILLLSCNPRLKPLLTGVRTI